MSRYLIKIESQENTDKKITNLQKVEVIDATNYEEGMQIWNIMKQGIGCEYLQPVYRAFPEFPDLIVVCDEEGKYKEHNLPVLSLYQLQDYAVGTCYICQQLRIDNDEGGDYILVGMEEEVANQAVQFIAPYMATTKQIERYIQIKQQQVQKDNN